MNTYKPDGTGHCKRCGRDVRTHIDTRHDSDPGREFVCPTEAHDYFTSPHGGPCARCGGEAWDPIHAGTDFGGSSQ